MATRTRPIQTEKENSVKETLDEHFDRDLDRLWLGEDDDGTIYIAESADQRTEVALSLDDAGVTIKTTHRETDGLQEIDEMFILRQD